MVREYRSPGTAEGGGTLLEARWSTRGAPRWAPAALAMLILMLQTACATGSPLGGTLAGGTRHRWRVARTSPETGARVVGAQESVSSSEGVNEDREGTDVDAARHRARRASEADEEEHLERKGVGWPDGVGDGRPFEVPMSLDYFQGFLVRAGVPGTALPKDGRTLGPQQALALVPHLLSTPITLGNFGLRRMAAHLLLEVATGEEVVTREELHARMRRFSR
ncbi:hypothetical protein, partial [Archangium sp.]|uniref:hypothetical protein n=1 Tax=Archangium sp. TaxID=1872627 RepID=UPI0038D3E8DF